MSDPTTTPRFEVVKNPLGLDGYGIVDNETGDIATINGTTAVHLTRWEAKNTAGFLNSDPSSAPSEAGAQEADCPSSEKQLSRARTPDEYGWPTDAIEKLDALTERVRVLEEALRRIYGVPLSHNPRADASDMRRMARKALSGGGEQHDE